MKASYVILSGEGDLVWSGTNWENATDNGWLGRAARWSTLAGASNQITRIPSSLRQSDMRVAKYVPVRRKR